MNYSEIVNKIISFRDARDWKQFHSIKDLCMGMGIEVAELQELFLWKSEEQIVDTVKDSKEKISDEIADIFIFLTYISHDLNIDLNSAVLNKLKKNEEKYPVEKSKGSNKKYNEL